MPSVTPVRVDRAGLERIGGAGQGHGSERRQRGEGRGNLIAVMRTVSPRECALPNPSPAIRDASSPCDDGDALYPCAISYTHGRESRASPAAQPTLPARLLMRVHGAAG